ncbi:MAG: ribbon-helix-helix protein, CopG family [Sphingorhabdus sp.]
MASESILKVDARCRIMIVPTGISMKTKKTRHQFYLTQELGNLLDRHAAKSGVSKTAILTEALTQWLDRKDNGEIEERFGRKLDIAARAQLRTERKADAISEMLGLFIQHQLTAAAHMPAFDDETGRLGLARYRRFMQVVEGRLKKQVAPTTAEIMKETK